MVFNLGKWECAWTNKHGVFDICVWYISLYWFVLFPDHSTLMYSFYNYTVVPTDCSLATHASRSDLDLQDICRHSCRNHVKGKSDIGGICIFLLLLFCSYACSNPGQTEVFLLNFKTFFYCFSPFYHICNSYVALY